MVTLTSVLFLAAAAFPPMSAPARETQVRGFTEKGELVYEQLFTFPGGGKQIEYAFIVVADAGGKPVRVAEVYDHDDNRESAQGQALVKSAQGLDEGERLQEMYNPPSDIAVDDDLTPFTGPRGEKLSFTSQPEGKECALIATWTDPAEKVSAEVARDACGKSSVQVMFRPGGGRAAVAWNLPGVGVGEMADKRGHLAYVSARDLAAVDLLDAGGGVEGAASKLEAGGFHVAHRGKAMAKRAASAVYFAPGFEKEAKDAAAALGIAAAAVQPVTWKTPYALTVALAK